jgi:hypothetical protein
MTQALFINTLFPFSASFNTNKEAKALIEQARFAFELGKIETKFAAEADEASSANEDEPDKYLVNISTWHYGQALAKFREAINKFEEAKRFSLSPKYKIYVDLKIRQCLEHSMSCKLQQQKNKYGKIF